MDLRYATNPHQTATAEPVTPGRWPVRLVHGQPSLINLLDALNAWQLVREASRALGRPAATSFKHVSPAGAAVAGPVDDVMRELYGVGEVGPATSAYLRARDADPKSSYGDLAAVSDPVDAELADVLARVVCDGVVAPGFGPGTVERLSRKKNGRFLVLEADTTFEPPAHETREVFGLRLVQERDDAPLAVEGDLPKAARDDLLLGMVVLRYTQSNAVAYVRDGMTLGIGAGQQSRVDCTRLAGAKVDTWWLRRHPAVRALAFPSGVRRQERINRQLDFVEDGLSKDERESWVRRLEGVAFVSDGALPFRDNVDQASRHGVAYLAEPGGSTRSGDVEAACREHGITRVSTGMRLFHH